MSKDPVQQLVDEITLIRGEVQALKRTSLDREEAEKLNELLVESVDRMAEAAIGARRAVRSDLEADRAETARLAVQSATEAARSAVKGVKGELEAERRSYALSLSEARRGARGPGWQSWPIVSCPARHRRAPGRLRGLRDRDRQVGALPRTRGPHRLRHHRGTGDRTRGRVALLRLLDRHPRTGRAAQGAGRRVADMRGGTELLLELLDSRMVSR